MTCSKRQHSCWALHCRASGRSRGTARARRSRTDLTRRRERGRAPQNLPSRSRSSITSTELAEAGKGTGALSLRCPRSGIGTTRSDGRRRRAAASTARSCTLSLRHHKQTDPERSRPLPSLSNSQTAHSRALFARRATAHMAAAKPPRPKTCSAARRACSRSSTRSTRAWL